MTFKQQNYLIDFLKSFELIYEIEEFDEQSSIFDKIIDKDYKETVKNYTLYLNEHKSYIEKFINNDFNFLLNIFFNNFTVENFEQYVEKINSLTKNDIIKIITKQFSLDETFNAVDLDKLDLPETIKWNLFLLINDTQNSLSKLTNFLEIVYKKYYTHAQNLYSNYHDKISNLETFIKNEDTIYNLIFKNMTNKNIFDNITNVSILIMSINKVILHSTKNYKLLALGTFVYDYYLEQEHNKKLDTIQFQQILKVLADPTRYGIIKCINSGITSNKVMAEMFAISRPAITYQLKFLLENNIILIDDITKNYVVNKELISLSLNSVAIDLELNI